MPSRISYRFLTLFAAISIGFCATQVLAQAPKKSTKKRTYNRRVQMHGTPIDIQVPTEDIEESPSFNDMISFDTEVMMDITAGESLIPYLAQPQRTIDPKSKKKNRNWIVPASSDQQKADQQESEEKSTPKGWGWLVDDVMARQQEKPVDRRAVMETDDEATMLPSERHKRNQTRNSGLLLDTTYKPVPTESLMKRTQDRDVMERVTIDENLSAFSTAEEQAEQQMAQEDEQHVWSDNAPAFSFGNESAWGGDHVWNSNSRENSSVLPQTASLLSRPSEQQQVSAARSMISPGVGSLPSPTAPSLPQSSFRSTPRSLIPSRSSSSVGGFSTPQTSKSMFRVLEISGGSVSSPNSSPRAGHGYLDAGQLPQPSRSLGSFDSSFGD